MGSRTTRTAKELWQEIRKIKVGLYCTDSLRAYEKILPQNQHIANKSQTYCIEGLNSRIRHYLARFKRETKCYSKSIDMVIASLKLLFNKLNNSILT